MDTFYKEDANEERYSGLSRRRPLVPENEIWVFRSVDGENAIVYGDDPEALPPAAPLLRAMTIYKFWRRRDIPWSVTFFEDSECNVTIKMEANLFLRDPIQFMTRLQTLDRVKHNDLKDLFPEWEKSLQAAFKDESFGSARPLRSMREREVVLPLALSQLQPEEDLLSHYIQGGSEMQKLGLDGHIIVQMISVSGAYRKLVQSCLDIAQKYLHPLKQALLVTAIHIQQEKLLSDTQTDFTEPEGALSQKVALQKELYSEHLSEIEQLRPQFYQIIEEGMLRNNLKSNTLRTAIFHEMLCQMLEQVSSQITSAQLPSLSEISSNPAYERAEQIRSFYLAAHEQTNGWDLFPKSPEKVIEEINISLDGENHLLLTVPSAYPQPGAKPAIANVKIQGHRLPQENVNKVITPILQSNNYTLMLLVQAVRDGLVAENEEDIIRPMNAELPQP